MTLTYQVAHNVFITSGYYESLTKRLKVDDRVGPTLDVYREDIEAERIIVAELHDGKTNTSGVRFAYMSGTYESDDAGIMQLLVDFQNIPTSILAGSWGPLLEHKCITLLGDTPLVEHLETKGAKKLLVCPIISPRNEYLIGVTVATWRFDKDISAETIKDMERLSLIVSGLIYEARE